MSKATSCDEAPAWQSAALFAKSASAPAPRKGSAGSGPAPAYSAIHVGIAGVGAVATCAALVLLVTALPGLTQANAAQLRATYKARVPGPGCDGHGALWTVTPGEPVTTKCGKGGLHVEVGPHADGDVKFLPPNGFVSADYRISVTIALGSGFNGCAGIFTRASAAGRYLTCVGADDTVGIDKFGAHGVFPIYLGFTTLAPAYTITAVSQGPDQSIYVGKKKIGTAVDAAFSKTEYIGLGITNTSNATDSVVFRKFSYRPLFAAPGAVPSGR